MEILGIPVALVLLAIFCQMWRIKLYHCYEGAHYSPEQKPVTYHPYENDIHRVLQYPQMWMSRMEGASRTLVCPLEKFSRLIEEQLEEKLSNWKWTNVDLSEWPMSWRNSKWTVEMQTVMLQWRAEQQAVTGIKSHRINVSMALT